MMDDKPLEQILNEFRQSIQKENTDKHQSRISRYYQRLAKPVSSAFRFIKNKAADAGSLVKELYEEGTLKTYAKYGGIITAGGSALAVMGYGAYKLFEKYGDYVISAGIAGVVSAAVGYVSGSVAEAEYEKGNISTTYWPRPLSTLVGGLLGIGAGIVVNNLHPFKVENPASLGIIASIVCGIAIPVGIAVSIKEQEARKK